MRNSTWDNKNLPERISEGLYLEFQTPYENGEYDNYIDVGLGFFYAPVSGQYRFFTSGDDNYELWLSSVPGVKSKDKMVKIAYLYGWTDWHHYYSFPTQISDYINLEGGKYYYVESYHCEGGGASHFTVSVEIPKKVAPGADNNLDAVMEISIEAEKEREVFEIKIYGWATGEYKLQFAIRDPQTK
jgi:hypothetical protein